MKRRDFLKSTVIAGTAGSLLDACAPGTEKIIPILIEEEEFIPGVEEWLATTCYQCPGGCGLLARKIDGRLVKIEGNPAHPISRGGSCARGQALPQALYHPDRVRSPLLRVGGRGENRWKTISWDEALERLGSALNEVRENDDADSLAFLTGALHGHRAEIVSRFLMAFGSPQRLIHEPFGDQAVLQAHRLATGVESFFATDLENTNYFVSFGASLVDGLRSPVRFGRGLGHMRRGRPGARAKTVAVEPRLSLTAANADEWLPVRPGTEAALALGLAFLLVHEDWIDAELVQEGAQGFEAFREDVLPRFEPSRVSNATGIPEKQLRRVAREMAEHRPTLVVAGDAAVSGPAGLATALAVSHLNALLGSYGAPGGLYVDPKPPFTAWPPVSAKEPAPLSLASVATELASSASSASSKRSIEVLLVSGTNPIHTLPGAFELREAFSRIPFIAGFTSYLDETTGLADLVLPESTPFERFDDDVPSPGVSIPMASLSGPLFERPLYDTRSMPDVLIQLANQLGGEMASAFPWPSYEQALRDAWSGLGGAGSWDRALKEGGWWDTTYSPRGPAGRYRFEIGPFRDARTDAPTTEQEFPYWLHVYPSASLGDGKSANLPFLQELADPMTGVRWGTVIELNSETAAELGVVEGAIVELESPHGRIRAAAHLTQGLRPDVVAVAAGQAHSSYGRYASGRGANVFEVLAPHIEPSSGEASLSLTRVRVRKI